MCPKNILEATLKQLVKILRSSGCRKVPVFVNTPEDVLMSAENFVSERICPIFQVSNVSGTGLDLLKLFMNVLQSNSNGKYDKTQPFEYHITDTFSVPGVGTVVSGTVVSGNCVTFRCVLRNSYSILGTVAVGDSLLLGPDTTGHFTPTVVKSIQRKRVNVMCATAGQSVSFGLKKTKRASIRKGMIMARYDVYTKIIEKVSTLI
jgi:GTPase